MLILVRPLALRLIPPSPSSFASVCSFELLSAAASSLCCSRCIHVSCDASLRRRICASLLASAVFCPCLCANFLACVARSASAAAAVAGTGGGLAATLALDPVSDPDANPEPNPVLEPEPDEPARVMTTALVVAAPS